MIGYIFCDAKNEALPVSANSDGTVVVGETDVYANVVDLRFSLEPAWEYVAVVRAPFVVRRTCEHFARVMATDEDDAMSIMQNTEREWDSEAWGPYDVEKAP